MNEDLVAHREAVSRLADFTRLVGPLEFVDAGGGFGVPYREDEAPLDLAAAAMSTREALGEADAQLVLEPGRYLVADASLILTEVNTVKETPETTVVGVDASLSTLIRPAMFGSYHPIRAISSPGAPLEPVTIGGPVCSSADVFCTDRELPRPGRGDLLAIGNAGAYGYELATHFHSQPRPVDVAIEGGEEWIARQREDLDDITRLEGT